MADPLPIIRTLCNTPQIARVFGLNGIVTLVDAKNALHRLREVDESDVEREEAEEAAREIERSRKHLVSLLSYP